MEAPHAIEARCRSILRKSSRATGPGFWEVTCCLLKLTPD